jgi:hypothetical protein
VETSEVSPIELKYSGKYLPLNIGWALKGTLRLQKINENLQLNYN